MIACSWCEQAARENVRPLPHDCPNAPERHPELSGYSVEFMRNPLLKTWGFIIRTPDGRRLLPLAPLGFVSRESAETEALRRMQIDADRDTMTGPELAAKIRRSAE